MSADDARTARVGGRWATTTFCAVAVVAALVGVLSWAIAARTRHVVIRHRLDAVPVAISVAECPAGHVCDVDATVRPDVIALVRATFGPASIVESDAVVDVISGQTFLEHVTALPGAGVSIDLTSRCISGAQPVESTRTTTAPAIGPAALRAVVAGTGGCSVVVSMQADNNALAARPWAEAVRLAHSPVAQLDP